MINYDYYSAIHGMCGENSIKDAEIDDAKENISFEMGKSIVCVNAMRNGIPQKFCVVPKAASYMYGVIAFPGDDLFTGDLLEFNDRHWMVTEVPSAPIMQYEGTVWECNHLFRFQTFDGTVVERWGVLDSGNYTSSISESNIVTIPNNQYRMYMQRDPQTEQIFRGKRLAVGTLYDQDGNLILDTYKVIDVDGVSRSYGGGHLLVLRAESSMYNPDTDNIDEMICDYIGESGKTDSSTNIKCVINGRDILKIGVLNRYTFSFIDADGNELQHGYGADISIDYQSVDPMCFDAKISDNECSILTLDKSLIGSTVLINVTPHDAQIKPVTKKVEVVSTI